MRIVYRDYTLFNALERMHALRALGGDEPKAVALTQAEWQQFMVGLATDYKDLLVTGVVTVELASTPLGDTPVYRYRDIVLYYIGDRNSGDDSEYFARELERELKRRQRRPFPAPEPESDVGGVEEYNAVTGGVLTPTGFTGSPYLTRTALSTSPVNPDF